MPTSKKKQENTNASNPVSAPTPLASITDTHMPASLETTEKQNLDTAIALAKPKKEIEETVQFYGRPKKKGKLYEDEDENKGDLSGDYMVVCTTSDASGKLLGYSIGINGKGDEYHDVSNLNMSRDEFMKELDSTMINTLNADKDKVSFRAAKDNIESKFPGQATYASKDGFGPREFQWSGGVDNTEKDDLNADSLPKPG